MPNYKIEQTKQINEKIIDVLQPIDAIKEFLSEIEFDIENLKNKQKWKILFGQDPPWNHSCLKIYCVLVKENRENFQLLGTEEDETIE